LVELDEDSFCGANCGRRPRYAVIPAFSDRRLVADLNRTMTVEKSVVAGKKLLQLLLSRVTRQQLR
jgi:hypothetical protein